MLSLSRIEKTFGATRALKSVTLEAAGGTVLGLAGENGAGKSTLIKIVSGAVVPDHGTVALDGKQLALRDTNDAISQGVSSVFQELTLVRELSVERNLLLTSAPIRAWGSISRARAPANGERDSRAPSPGRRSWRDRRRSAARPAADAGDRARR